MQVRNCKMRITSFIICVFMILSLLPDIKTSAYTDTSSIVNINDYSNNTNESEFKITDAAGLNTLSSLVNSGNNFSGKIIYLANDINFDFTTNNFTAIGLYNQRPFSGTFDGNGYIISGINISRPTSNYQAIFGYIDSANIINVSLENSSITGAGQVAGIAGISINSTIENCSNAATLSSGNGGITAGIVAANLGNVINCYNVANLINNSSIIGGVVGRNQGNITRCYNSGNITGSSNASLCGGVAGENISVIENCYNTSNINAGASRYTGGITAITYSDNSSSSMKNCYNVGNVSGASAVGSVAGAALSTSPATTFTNNYYLQGTASSGIGENQINAIVNSRTSEEMQSNIFAYNLNTTNSTESNSGIWTRNDSLNNGYPIFGDSNNAVYKLDIINNSSNGTISYNSITSGSAYVVAGSQVNLVVTPNNNYLLSGLTINGTSISNTNGEFIMPEEDSTVSPVFSLISVYSIELATNGGTISSDVSIPTEYTVLSPTIILPTASQITRKGYSFEGWYREPDFSGSQVTEIPTGSTGDIILYAKWSDPVIYTITFENNGGTIDSSYEIPTQYTVLSPTIVLPTASQITRPGFKFVGWYDNADFSGDVITEIPTGSAGNITLYANWAELENFTITLVNNGGVISSDVTVPADYNEQSPTIVLPVSGQITRNGYNFEGWYDNANFDGEPITEIPTGSTGNKVFYARWSDPINYFIILDSNGGTISSDVTVPTEYNIESDTITLPTASEITRAGYNFQGWYNNTDFTGEAVTEIPSGSTGNVTLYANWGNPIQYSITVDVNGGTISPSVSIPGEYTITTDTIVLPTADEVTRSGYNFQGWYDNPSFLGDAITEIPQGSTGNITLYANWGSPINYSITLNNNGGTIDSSVTVPSQYNVESGTITLPTSSQITRNGYNFEGWYDNPVFFGDAITEIPQGSTGDKVFYARWSDPIEYSITFVTNGGTIDPTIVLPDQYTVESETYILPTSSQITRTNYRFAGWYDNEELSGSPITEIPQGSTGNITLYASWNPLDSFTITLETNGGTINDGVVVPSSYTEDTETITLPTEDEITRVGYTFEGWYDNAEFEGNPITEIPEGSTGNKVFYARWSDPLEYNITLNTNGGVISTEIDFPDQYTVESATIQLPTANEITRAGYDFIGWYESEDFSGDIVTEIPEGSTGNKVFYAKWSDPILYTITLETNQGTINSDFSIPNEYTVLSDTINLPTSNDISRLGYNFEGWYDNEEFEGNPVTEIPEGSTGNKVFYARWSDPIVYSINYEPNGGTLSSGVVIPSLYTVASETIVLPTASEITKQNAKFIGWYNNPDFSGSIIKEIPQGSTGNIDIYAKWNELREYTITVNTNGGVIDPNFVLPTEYTSESNTIQLPNATQISRPGYNFEGWYNNPNFVGNPITEIPTGSSGNISIYARWSDPIVYSITVETNEGTLNSGVTIPDRYTVESATIVLPTASEITRAGYNFAGWYNNAEFNGTPITEIPQGSTGNITLYARWNQSNEYTITVNTNGGVINPDFNLPSSYTSETPTIVLPTASDITRAGYNFEGWYNNAEFNGTPITEIPQGSTGNITLYAKWSSPIEYTITVDTNGGTLKEGVTIPNSYNVTSATIVLPTASEIVRDGYTFVGWYSNSDFAGNIITEIPTGSTGDISLYAKWRVNQSEENNSNNNINSINNNNSNNLSGLSNLLKGKSVLTGDGLNAIALIILIAAALYCMTLAIKKKKK